MLLHGPHDERDRIVLAVATQSYYVRLQKCVCATGRTGGVQFEVIDTTIHSPWWFISDASGYDAFIERANTTSDSHARGAGFAGIARWLTGVGYRCRRSDSLNGLGVRTEGTQAVSSVLVQWIEGPPVLD